MEKYILKEFNQNVIDYKYKGVDNSIYYRYVMSPFCEYITNYFPKWLAPNTITVFDFFLNFLYFLLIIYYTNFELNKEVPSWLCYFTVIVYNIYMILDNCDGKQAKRTQSGSPLGLIFDHGVDSCTTFFISIAICHMCYFQNWYNCLFLWFTITFTFYLNTWEEYITGVLNLPIIHGVSEGTFIIDFLFILSGLYGKKIYLYELTFLNKKLFVSDWFSFLITLSGIFFGLISIINVKKFLYEKKRKYNIINDLIIYFILLGSFSFISFFNSSNLIYKYSTFIILIFGLEFSRIVIYLQLCHIQNCKYNPFTFCNLFPLIILNLYTLLNIIFKDILFSIDYLIYFCFIWNLISWFHLVYFSTEELCNILNIKRFSLKKDNKKEN